MEILLAGTVDSILQNKFANESGKLAALLSAKHVEKAQKKKEAQRLRSRRWEDDEE